MSYFYDIIYENDKDGIKQAVCRKCSCGCQKFMKDRNNNVVCLSCGKEVQHEM